MNIERRDKETSQFGPEVSFVVKRFPEERKIGASQIREAHWKRRVFVAEMVSLSTGVGGVEAVGRYCEMHQSFIPSSELFLLQGGDLDISRTYPDSHPRRVTGRRKFGRPITSMTFGQPTLTLFSDPWVVLSDWESGGRQFEIVPPVGILSYCFVAEGANLPLPGRLEGVVLEKCHNYHLNNSVLKKTVVRTFRVWSPQSLAILERDGQAIKQGLQDHRVELMMGVTDPISTPMGGKVR